MTWIFIAIFLYEYVLSQINKEPLKGTTRQMFVGIFILFNIPWMLRRQAAQRRLWTGPSSMPPCLGIWSKCSPPSPGTPVYRRPRSRPGTPFLLELRLKRKENTGNNISLRIYFTSFKNKKINIPLLNSSLLLSKFLHSSPFFFFMARTL